MEPSPTQRAESLYSHWQSPLNLIVLGHLITISGAINSK